MKRFIIKLTILFAICVVLDSLVGLTSSYLQKNSTAGLTRKDEFLKTQMDADILILGSSRAMHHYVANLMADSLHCSVYNAGMDGKGIIMNYGVALEVTNRYNPKIIIYEITPPFDWVEGDNDKYLAHLRHAYNIKGIDSIFWRVNPAERLKMLSNSYRVNSLVPHLINDNLISQKDTLNGYVPQWKVWNGRRVQESNAPIIDLSVDSLKVEYLNKFIRLCKDKNINLIFSISPTHEIQQDTYTYGILLAQKNKIPLINYKELRNVIEADSLFQDETHLNDAGAHAYTLEVINWLKENGYTERVP